MKPLVLHDIAEAVELHESTISRVTTQKYMLTPAGVFELKYFFSSHVSTSSGGEVSSTAIRALIKKLVAEENPRKPLSDSKIAKLLEEQIAHTGEAAELCTGDAAEPLAGEAAEPCAGEATELHTGEAAAEPRTGEAAAGENVTAGGTT